MIFYVKRSGDNLSVRRLMNFYRIMLIFAALCAMFILAACEGLAQEFASQTQRLPGLLPFGAPSGCWWNPDGARGPSKIVVNLGEQRAYFYKGRHVVGESTVSTGKPGFSTPPGHYHVVEKDRNHVSSEFGDYIDDWGNSVKSNIDVRKDSQPRGSHFDGARMPYFMRFNGGYGMHAGYVPRFRASHGCIRLPAQMAKHFFENAAEDTPVIVKE